MQIRECDNGDLFDIATSKKVCSSWNNRSTRWSTLYRTEKGAYILHHATRWEGETDTFELVDIVTAKRFAATFASDDDFNTEFSVSSAELI